MSVQNQEDRNPGTPSEGSAPLQVPYRPKSRGPAIGTLIPRNLELVFSKALDALERRVGPLDEYVRDKLGFRDEGELFSALAAEQVDATAMAIDAIDNGLGAINGDQTGIGKGRVAAAIIRYANRTGRIPLFVTCKPDLYADMGRDLAAVGMQGFKPFPTNSNLNVPMPDGSRLKTDTDNHKLQMQQAIQTGNLGSSYEGIFTTYSQMQTVKGEDTLRRDFLRAMAPRSLLILDEAHEAGGPEGESSGKSRGEFARELVSSAQGVLYSSATYAKSPSVMTLYSRTDMRHAVGSLEALVGLIQKGSVPMQQGLATMLALSGQYVRRERSFEGVSFECVTVPVDRPTAENVAGILRSILEFDRAKESGVSKLDQSFKAEAKAIARDNSIGQAGCTSTNFTAIMHNLIDQMLLSLKAEATADHAIAVLRNPDPATGRAQKPLVAVANTMGSFIGEYADQNDLRPGDGMDLDFGGLLERYLVRSRDICMGDAFGKKEYRQLTDSELGPYAVRLFESIRETIRETDFGSMPISPIDHIKSRLTEAGFKVGEITGRKDVVRYSGGRGYYDRRGADECSKAANIETVRAYNAGDLDCVILNRSGSTGISLHASREVADQRRRHLIVAQPERNIDVFMQMLGRVHRTGQVVPPNYTLLMADIPAEKRPGAVLAKKMASLNANTTAARTTAVTVRDVPDFMNEYGDRVVKELMDGYPDLHARLDHPLGTGENPYDENAIARVTGRIPLLPIAEQEKLYDLIETEYNAYVERQAALGESVLEAETLDLDARTVGTLEVVPAIEGIDSPFASGVALEVIDAKTTRKPLTSAEVLGRVAGAVGLAETTALEDCERVSVLRAASLIGQLCEGTAEFERAKLASLPQKKRQAYSDKLSRHLARVTDTVGAFPTGTRVRLTTKSGNFMYGVVDQVWASPHEGANPALPSNWRMAILVADPAKEIVLPFSQINTGEDFQLESAETDLVGTPVLELFDQRQGANREERQLFTGNVLRAFEKFHGKLVNFTDHRGDVRQGVLAPQGYDFFEKLEREPVVLPTPADVLRFVDERTHRRGQAKSHPDAALTLKADRRFNAGGGYVLQTVKSKSIGSKFYLDTDLLRSAGAEFVSSGDQMVLAVPKEHIGAVLDTLYSKGTRLAAFDGRDTARDMLGIDLPQLNRIEQAAPELEGEMQVADVRLDASPAVEVPPDTSAPHAIQDPSRLAPHATSKETVRSLVEPQTVIGTTAPTVVPATVGAADGHHLETPPQSVQREPDTPAFAAEFPYVSENSQASVSLTKTPTGPEVLVGSQTASDLSIPNVDAPADVPSVPAMAVVHEMIERVNPRLGEYLSQSPGVADPGDTLSKLRDWYRAAAAMEKPYLDMIARVGKSHKDGKPPVEKVLRMMDADLASHAKIERDVVAAACKILASRGRPIDGGRRLYEGNRYVLRGDVINLTVNAAQRGVILSVVEGKVARNSLCPDDVSRFLKMGHRVEGKASLKHSKGTGFEH
ncbi:strawberry notch C-terminal domain-containing protein [Gloeobacter morelensis]|uniref:strawberry notch C-terminal domain-containing protein n=1 Tax=Gloeobacter morelensis TaxID=2907343 RepID=UPI001E3939F2|nr:strawberry notch C-terminal domain-containing protein [Gloeobacter morelensis]UFP97146.1 strawberry notch C-terminal domain-containing protein [Gloeobacter morelensis MG652769]